MKNKVRALIGQGLLATLHDAFSVTKKKIN